MIADVVGGSKPTIWRRIGGGFVSKNSANLVASWNLVINVVSEGSKVFFRSG